jgi:non-heme chloroperoxidase
MGPFWLKTVDNPVGKEESQFNGWQAALRADRAATLLGIIKNARNYDVLSGMLVSDASIQEAWNIAVAASPIAAVECIAAMKTDFRADIPHITVPTLILHAGDTDRILPPELHSRRLAKLIPDVKFVEIEDAPHDIQFTHAERVNQELLDFLR